MTYPPPTLIKRRSRSAWMRYVVLLLTVAIVLGTCTATRFIGSSKPASEKIAESSRDQTAVVEAPSAPSGQAIDVQPAPVAAAPPPAEAPAAAAAPVAEAAAAVPSQAGDARQPNRWYYVGALGDGPGAIYSRTGGQWDYAFACALPARTIEFIAVNTGDPAGFDRQSMTVGTTTKLMDATYARSGGGTIATKLPARDPFFSKLVNGATLEVQLLANRRVLLPIGADVVKLVRACRGS